MGGAWGDVGRGRKTPERKARAQQILDGLRSSCEPGVSRAAQRIQNKDTMGRTHWKGLESCPNTERMRSGPEQCHVDLRVRNKGLSLPALQAAKQAAQEGHQTYSQDLVGVPLSERWPATHREAPLGFFSLSSPVLNSPLPRRR